MYLQQEKPLFYKVFSLLTGYTGYVSLRMNDTNPKTALTTISLTNTEMEILKRLCEGMLYKEIALERKSAFETVKKHISNIYRKLDVGNRFEACKKFRESASMN